MGIKVIDCLFLPNIRALCKEFRKPYRMLFRVSPGPQVRFFQAEYTASEKPESDLILLKIELFEVC